MIQVTLRQVLQAREDRVRLQQQFLRDYRCPLICFTMNIAGPVKNSPLIQRGFQEGLRALEMQLPPNSVKKLRVDSTVTGCQAIYAVNRDASELKKICIAIEEGTPLGRLFDMDVLDTDGTKLERSNLRGCFVCGAAGRVCAAGRIHSVPQLQAVTTQILRDYFMQADIKRVASVAVQSLIDEVHTTPKPGLVDRRNCGSHQDMDLSTFTASAMALQPYFAECVKIGQNTANDSPESCFSQLRQAGLAAEKAMYQATGGVNTHKGAVYIMGLVCGSIGRLWAPETPIAENAAIVAECARIVSNSVDSDLASADNSTAGFRLYRQYGIKGIRGEAAAGLPSVMHIGLPAYQDGLCKGLSPNDAGAVALLHLIAKVEDTNLYHRGGYAGAVWAAEAAQNLLSASLSPTMASIEQLDDAFIARNLSAGGCADLLAVTYFLHSLHSQN